MLPVWHGCLLQSERHGGLPSVPSSVGTLLFPLTGMPEWDKIPGALGLRWVGACAWWLQGAPPARTLASPTCSSPSCCLGHCPDLWHLRSGLWDCSWAAERWREAGEGAGRPASPPARARPGSLLRFSGVGWGRGPAASRGKSPWRSRVEDGVGVQRTSGPWRWRGGWQPSPRPGPGKGRCLAWSVRGRRQTRGGAAGGCAARGCEGPAGAVSTGAFKPPRGRLAGTCPHADSNPVAPGAVAPRPPRCRGEAGEGPACGLGSRTRV